MKAGIMNSTLPTPGHSSYKDSLLKSLKEPLEAANYLLAAAEDSPEAFKKALANINLAHSLWVEIASGGLPQGECEAVYIDPVTLAFIGLRGTEQVWLYQDNGVEVWPVPTHWHPLIEERLETK